MTATGPAEGDFEVAPMMLPVPAVVVRPDGFLIAPRSGRASIAFGASPAPDGGAMLCISVQHDDGTMLVAAIPEQLLPDLTEAISHAARQMETRRFAQTGTKQ